MRVLVVEDHCELADTLAGGLPREGWRSTWLRRRASVATYPRQPLRGRRARSSSAGSARRRGVPDVDGGTVSGSGADAHRGRHHRGQGRRLSSGADNCLPNPFAFVVLVAASELWPGARNPPSPRSWCTASSASTLSSWTRARSPDAAGCPRGRWLPGSDRGDRSTRAAPPCRGRHLRHRARVRRPQRSRSPFP